LVHGNFTISKDRNTVISAKWIHRKNFRTCDKDGFVDLFIGGRTPFLAIFQSEKSFLLKNENGVF